MLWQCKKQGFKIVQNSEEMNYKLKNKRRNWSCQFMFMYVWRAGHEEG